MTNSNLTLISHHLCPYVQRVAIALSEKEVPFEKVYIDLANKPDWFNMISPLGKTPVLKVADTAIFESAVILEYLEETQPNRLYSDDPLLRARHRSWIEFGSSVLSDIGGLYSAADKNAFDVVSKKLTEKFMRLESQLTMEPFFSGSGFSLVDVAFGPVFRYFGVFDRIGDFGILSNKPKIAAWRKALADRHSIQNAVTDDYETRLWDFLKIRKSHLASLMD